MHAFLKHPGLRLTCRFILRREARRGNANAAKILANSDAFDYFTDGLPYSAGMAPEDVVTLSELGDEPIPPTPGPDHPILDWFKGLIQWAIDHPEEIMAFIMFVLKLFGL